MRKHLLYLGNDHLCAYLWQAGRLLGGTRFACDRAGVDAFMDYLDGHAEAPVYLLADLVEEDFVRLSLPHVGGGAGRRLLARRLQQQYRETPFRHVELHGREPGGRRDDIALLSALTNPALVAPWVEAVEQLKLPLAGLYSTTLLGALLAARLDLKEQHLLLVTQQSGGWRQTYFLDGQLKFSRLTPALDRDGAPVNVAAETGKTQQFLTSIRLLQRGAVLHTAVIAPAATLDQLAALCEDGAETAYRFIALETANTKAGLKGESDPDGLHDALPAIARLADGLLLALLARHGKASHYSLGQARRYHQLWQTRRVLRIAGAALAACSLVWTGANLWHYRSAIVDGERMVKESIEYTARYREVMANMPQQVSSTANMRAAVTVERMLATQAPTPQTMALMLSEALEQVPQIRLLQLDWRVDLAGAQPSQQQSQQASQDGAPVEPPSMLLAGIPQRPPQTLRVEAEILEPEDDYRSVLERMNQFAQLLARRQQLAVEIEKPPIDTRSSVKLSGKAGAQAVENRAKFTLKLSWKP